jgi:hypothetical protein
MTQEQRFLAALTSVTAFRHEHRTLWLIDAAGRARVRLTQIGGRAELAHPSRAHPRARSQA